MEPTSNRQVIQKEHKPLIKKQRKTDPNIIKIDVSEIFAPLKITGYINGNQKDYIWGSTYFELIEERKKENLPYKFTLVQDVNSENLYPFDGTGLSTWLENNSINPLTGKKMDITFEFSFIEGTKTKRKCFSWKEGVTPSLKMSSTCIKIDVSTIFAPLKMIAFLDTKDEDPIEKKTYSELIKNQKEKNLPSILTIVQKKGSSHLHPTLSFCLESLVKVNNIFFFTLKFNEETKKSCFEYLGNINESSEKMGFLIALNYASQGNFHYQWHTGNCYSTGKGVAKDDGQAFNYYKLAADQGYLDAQKRVALCYYHGKGTERNCGEAFKYFGLAAKQGHAESQFRIASLYYQGYDVGLSQSEVYELLLDSANQGYKNAKVFLDSLIY